MYPIKITSDSYPLTNIKLRRSHSEGVHTIRRKSNRRKSNRHKSNRHKSSQYNNQKGGDGNKDMSLKTAVKLLKEYYENES